MKTLYHLRGFQGPDVSLEISLREYGIAWKKDKGRNDYLIVYGIAITENRELHCFDYTRFSFVHFSYKDWGDMLAAEWFCREKFKEYAEASDTDLLNPDCWVHYLQSAIAYHGVENVFGTCYYEGFTIGSKKENARYAK